MLFVFYEIAPRSVSKTSDDLICKIAQRNSIAMCYMQTSINIGLERQLLALILPIIKINNYNIKTHFILLLKMPGQPVDVTTILLCASTGKAAVTKCPYFT